MDYLCQAAENGKEVDVLIELKARFDEQNNIDYSEKLEDAGCNVIYGFERYKVHSKVCLITKIIASKPEYAALIATGNFNENTAKSYTDLAYITSRADIIKDVVSFFANMAIGRLDGKYNTLLVSPVSLKSTILSLMDQEIVKGEQGVITCKLNSITDEDIIERLHEASLAGVKVKLIVRGISCICRLHPDLVFCQVLKEKQTILKSFQLLEDSLNIPESISLVLMRMRKCIFLLQTL